jgi:peptidoglycan/LPS O-acetylase OafA/YrhL
LDGLRALAVLLVLLFHSWFERPGYILDGQSPQDYPLFYGRTGVQLFFVLSGFLLFLPYARSLHGLQKHPSAILFYTRRVLRVGPAYWISILLLLPLAPLTLARFGDGAAHALFMSNAFTNTVYSYNGVFWTMAIEVQFYVLLPLLGFLGATLARRLGPTRGFIALLALLGMLSLAADRLADNAQIGALPVAGILVGQPSVWNWLAVFGSGMACAFLYVRLNQNTKNGGTAAIRFQHVATGLFVVGATAAVAIAFVPALHNLPLKTQLYGVAYACVLMGILFGTRALRRPFEWRAVRFVGLISYSFYIWHTVVMGGLETVVGPALSPDLAVIRSVALALPASIAAAYLSYLVTERPFMAARLKAHEPPTSPA